MTVRSRSLTRATTSAPAAVLAVVLAVVLATTLAACGGSEDPQATPTPTVSTPATSTPTPTPTPTAEPEGTVIAIDIDDADAGRREKIEVGEEVVLRITSTEAGTLHVHSSPEQELDFPAGTTDLPLVIDQPGIVDVEDHATDALLVQLEVS